METERVCEQCGEEGHTFREADQYGEWTEDCEYLDAIDEGGRPRHMKGRL